LDKKHWKALTLTLQIIGIILLLQLIFIYYTALQEVTGMVVFPYRNEALWLSLLGILLLICATIINQLKN
jgi:divalent metal cation (Fe/Co/Zn/Cd) transporter